MSIGDVMEKLQLEKSNLKDSYLEALKDPKLQALVKKLKISDEVAMNYTSKLEQTIEELSNCSKCKGLPFCQNPLEGHYTCPVVKDQRLSFGLKPCKYLEEIKENKNKKITMKDIRIDDKRRAPVIKYFKEFLDKVEHNEKVKGLYLYGNFGCGKTFLITALFSELEKRRKSCEIVYYPELLRDLKSDFDDFGGKMEYLMDVDYLLLDDIGAEKVTEWSRDEILGTILQYRMNNNKVTFFTSNLSLKELELNLAGTKGEIDVIKARRIIERIKYLSTEMQLLGENRRVD